MRKRANQQPKPILLRRELKRKLREMVQQSEVFAKSCHLARTHACASKPTHAQTHVHSDTHARAHRLAFAEAHAPARTRTRAHTHAHANATQLERSRGDEEVRDFRESNAELLQATYRARGPARTRPRAHTAPRTHGPARTQPRAHTFTYSATHGRMHTHAR